MLLDFPIIGFFVIFFSSLLLFGEMLVKTRGIFALIGIGLMAVYFSYFVNDENVYLLSFLYVAGLLTIIIDAKLLNHGIVALFGVVMMMAAVAIPAPSVLYGVLAAIALLVGMSGSFVFLKVFRPRAIWGKLTLKDRLTSEAGYNSINEEYRTLIGRTGMTETPFRPSGTVKIEGKSYSAVSEGKWLQSDMPVLVTAVDGTRIVVQEKTD
ncbi:MAG TPA: NfeD family protein [Bacillales bacterium]|nr:NfeD family protein [Bacillales bacterium]